MAILEAEGIVAVALFLFWVWALFDCIATDASRCRNLPKGVWLILVLLLPDIGSLAWVLLGRPERAGWKPGRPDSSRRRPLGLEDQPRYLVTPDVSDRRSAELDRRLEAWEQEQSRKQIEAPSSDGAARPAEHLDAWEAELTQREADLRRRELELRERELSKRENELDED
jgi:hypothetical protein